MMSAQSEVKQWIIGGAVCGILADIAYGLAIGVPSLPDKLGMFLIFSFGPLLVVAALGLYHFIRLNRNSLMLQAGTAFMMLAGSLITLMICVQLSVGDTFRRLGQLKDDPTSATAYRTAFHAGNAVQLGADVAWDMFIFPAVVLLGLAMWRHPKLGRIIGTVGVLLGAAGIVLNIWTFPTPPAEAELIDVGPFVALWFLAVSVMVLRGVQAADEGMDAEAEVGERSRAGV